MPTLAILLKTLLPLVRFLWHIDNLVESIKYIPELFPFNNCNIITNGSISLGHSWIIRL